MDISETQHAVADQTTVLSVTGVVIVVSLLAGILIGIGLKWKRDNAEADNRPHVSVYHQADSADDNYLSVVSSMYEQQHRQLKDEEYAEIVEEASASETQEVGTGNRQLCYRLMLDNVVENVYEQLSNARANTSYTELTTEM